VKHLSRQGIDEDNGTVHATYNACADLANVLTWPLGNKSENEVGTMIREYFKNKEVFEATCVAQLKINTD
jgi:hypothetical protein